jgi:hypothetical protein
MKQPSRVEADGTTLLSAASNLTIHRTKAAAGVQKAPPWGVLKKLAGGACVSRSRYLPLMANGVLAIKIL